MKRKVIFRADASVEIGYGHFVRSLALANMLKDNFDCVFVTQSLTKYQESEATKVCTLVKVPTTNEKFRIFLDMLKGDEIVVLDNYFYDTDYQREIQNKGCKLVCIDDMHDKHYVADVVINHGVNRPELFSVEPFTRLLLGKDWALLRAPFLQKKLPKRNLSNQELHCIVNFGGVDSHCFTEKIALALECVDSISRITAIVGETHIFPPTISFSSKVKFRCKLSAEEMCELFLSGDFAVLSASTVAIEAMSCRLPLILGYYVENQKEIYHYAVESYEAEGIGDLRKIGWEGRLHNLVTTIKERNVPEFPSDIRERYIQIFQELAI